MDALKPMFETLLYGVSNGVATIAINRPEKLNAVNALSIHELISAFDMSDADDAVKVVIVTGAGSRAFCSGADISAGTSAFDFSQHNGRDQTALTHRDEAGVLALRILSSLKPVIAAVNGVAIGVGATMQLPMDIRLASTSARYGFVFSRRGIVPEAASSWFLPRLVGMQTALEWCYTGRLFSAQEALKRGLVHAVHEPDQLLPAALELAREIVDNAAPVAIAVTRQLMWRMLTAEHPMEAHKLESQAIFVRGRSADAREGIEAFLEKRPPRYPDKVSTDLPAFVPAWTEPSFD